MRLQFIADPGVQSFECRELAWMARPVLKGLVIGHKMLTIELIRPNDQHLGQYPCSPYLIDKPASSDEDGWMLAMGKR